MSHSFLDGPSPLGMAHRGGALEAPENSITAFARAVALGFSHIETDIRATSDGVPMVFHDERLDRVTDRVGRIRDLTYAEVRKARVGDGEPIPTLTEILERFPDTRFNIDIKEDHALSPVLEVLTKRDHLQRVCVASFSWRRLRAVRRTFGVRVCTALSPAEVAVLLSRSRWGRMGDSSRLPLPSGSICVQVPVRAGRVTLLTPAFVESAHDRSWPVHAWTIDQAPEMRKLLGIGVDGIITDRPKVLKSVLSDTESKDV